MQDLKKPIALMVVAAVLLAGLVAFAGFTYVESSRKSSPFFYCTEVHTEMYQSMDPVEVIYECSGYKLRR